MLIYSVSVAVNFSHNCGFYIFPKINISSDILCNISKVSVC